MFMGRISAKENSNSDSRQYIKERLRNSRKGMVEHEKFQQLHRLQHKRRVTF